MEYKPLRDNIIIILEKESEQETGGIFIPKDKWQDFRPLAKVVAVGPDVQSILPDTMVLVNPYAVIDIAGEEFKLISEKDILANVGPTQN